jgi:iron complex transport system ATP-binding protein
MLSFENVTAGYGDEPVITDVSFTVEAGEVVSLLGPNGVGKTTLLKTAVGLRAPSSGTVSVGGTPVDDLARNDLAKRIGYVPQKEENSMPSTVFETLLMGRKPYMGVRPADEDRDIVSNVLEELGLADLAMRDVRSLSGGQFQKVTVARAFVQQPEALVLDEPTSDLDIRYEQEVLTAIREWAGEGHAVLQAMHDLSVALRFSDRFVFLSDDGVHAVGGPEVVTAEVIESVYGVPVELIETDDGKFVTPTRDAGAD